MVLHAYDPIFHYFYLCNFILLLPYPRSFLSRYSYWRPRFLVKFTLKSNSFLSYYLRTSSIIENYLFKCFKNQKCTIVLYPLLHFEVVCLQPSPLASTLPKGSPRLHSNGGCLLINNIRRRCNDWKYYNGIHIRSVLWKEDTSCFCSSLLSKYNDIFHYIL